MSGSQNGQMIGVVVWSSVERQKAVIWCEDQGALAYLHGAENMLAGSGWPMAGDLVELASETRGDMRYARDVTLVNRQHFVDLPTILKQETPSPDCGLRLVVSDGQSVRSPDRDSGRDAREMRMRRLAVCGG